MTFISTNMYEIFITKGSRSWSYYASDDTKFISLLWFDLVISRV